MHFMEKSEFHRILSGMAHICRHNIINCFDAVNDTHTHRGAEIKIIVNRSKPTEKLQFYLRHVFSSAHFIINKNICLDHHRQHHQYLHIYIQKISSSLRHVNVCVRVCWADMRALGHVPYQPFSERKRHSHASLSMLLRFIEQRKTEKGNTRTSMNIRMLWIWETCRTLEYSTVCALFSVTR